MCLRLWAAPESREVLHEGAGVGGGGLKTDRALVPSSSQGNQNQAGLLAPTSPPNLPHCPLPVSLAWGEGWEGPGLSRAESPERVNPMLLGTGCLWVSV